MPRLHQDDRVVGGGLRQHAHKAQVRHLRFARGLSSREKQRPLQSLAGKEWQTTACKGSTSRASTRMTEWWGATFASMRTRRRYGICGCSAEVQTRNEDVCAVHSLHQDDRVVGARVRQRAHEAQVRHLRFEKSKLEHTTSTGVSFTSLHQDDRVMRRSVRQHEHRAQVWHLRTGRCRYWRQDLMTDVCLSAGRIPWASDAGACRCISLGCGMLSARAQNH